MVEEEEYLSDQDIFADESCQPVRTPKTPPVARQDSAEVARLRGMMAGVPPPPSSLQLDIPRILELWKSNIQLHWEGRLKEEKSPPKSPKKKKKEQKRITNIGLDTEVDDDMEKDADSSDDAEMARFDVYLNTDREEEEMLRLKVAERLISSETSSSFLQQTVLTNSAKKRQRRNGWSKSPGSRLSYLAKRRTVFSHRPNLGNARTISILKEDKKPSKDKKRVPLKRALFQSPDKVDFSTPDCSRLKRLKLSVPSPNRTTPPSSEKSRPTIKRPSVSRNLETVFSSVTQRTANPRQVQLWQRTPLASLSYRNS